MRRFLLLGAVVLGALVAYWLWLCVLVPTDRPRHADAIVVLAGDNGRVPTGMRLLRDGVAPVLELSLLPYRVPELDELCGNGSVKCFHAETYSTTGEAQTVARLARTNGWHRVVVVSSRYHLRRARMLFERCTTARVDIVAGRTTFVDYVKNAVIEPGKFAVQLIAKRGC